MQFLYLAKHMAYYIDVEDRLHEHGNEVSLGSLSHEPEQNQGDPADTTEHIIEREVFGLHDTRNALCGIAITLCLLLLAVSAVFHLI